MTEWSAVIFRSTHLAVKAERVVQKAAIDARLIPAPRHLSHDCGVALRIPREKRVEVEEAMVQGKVEYESIADLD